MQSSAAYVLFYRRRHGKQSGAVALIPTGLDANRSQSEQDEMVPEAAEAGIVANMSARPRENMGSQGRGRVVGLLEFGGAADLELLSSGEEDSSPARAHGPSPARAYGPQYAGASSLDSQEF